MTRYAASIGGEPVRSNDAFPVTDPSTGAVIAEVARCGRGEVDAAVAAARAAYEDTWRRTAVSRRAAVCRAMAAAITAHAGELADLETLGTGKPIGQARTDVAVAARYFEFYGATAEALFGETVLSEADVLAFTLTEPYGVSAHIIPWNYPLQVAARTLAPALAAGNCCVLKPAEDAPLTSLRLAEIALAAGFPPGALNVVPGYGEEAGAALAAHPGIDHLSFTGSREVGQAVMTAAAAGIVPVTLELGGKSPHLVFPDCDLDEAAALIHASITEHAGQNCSAGSRLLVHEDVHDALTERLATRFAAMTIGAGRDAPDLGPLISAKQRDRVIGYIEAGKREARLVTGGAAPDHTKGFFVRPTIFADVPRKARIAQEEIFGPVLCVQRFRDAHEAVALANDTSYGLSAGVWTRDIGLATWLCREIRAGQVFVNNYSAAGGVELPFGGHRRSGIGSEKGFSALREYTRTKSAAIRVVTP